MRENNTVVAPIASRFPNLFLVVPLTARLGRPTMSALADQAESSLQGIGGGTERFRDMAEVRLRAMTSHFRVYPIGNRAHPDILRFGRSLVYREEALVLRHGYEAQVRRCGQDGDLSQRMIHRVPRRWLPPCPSW